MSFDLNELRAQRDRVREHLAWLDQQIKQADASTLPVPPPSPLSGATLAASQSKQAPPPPINPTPVGATTKIEPVIIDTDIPMEFSPGGFDGRTKAGCILSAVLIMALFLFLLFGLPSLLS
ncbi:hypothetical protein [Cerasicoccus arenae]|uniref:Uncharacterized protein n=1 Tax=Cerasicoccus arenae TaxID=424488 RepID=A0A8J3DJG7_9BACT|nr:hypothetical protein [Cerasicoccus arenae]MBK1858500.1 hypothetical protein [Cerasicoccus arenae]GHC10248.1 hypothetical protein GCM10007047_29460 [Cerasicoccus arenae]